MALNFHRLALITSHYNFLLSKQFTKEKFKNEIQEFLNNESVRNLTFEKLFSFTTICGVEHMSNLLLYKQFVSVQSQKVHDVATISSI